MELFSQSSKKFLILQESKSLKKFLIFSQKKAVLNFGKRKPLKILYISGGTSKARKIKIYYTYFSKNSFG